MDIEFLLSFKDNENVQNFFIEIVNDNIIKNNYKNKFYNKKKIPIKKELITTIENKYNLILNKLSETNFNSIITEFIDNINYITLNEYEEFQKMIFYKIISEINFINLYLKYLELINYVYNNVLQYDLSYLINLVNIKFKLDYINEPINNDKYNFLNEININEHRINNIILIKKLYEYEIINTNTYNYYEDILFDNDNYISDIYYLKPNKNEQNTIKLKNILSKNLNIRDKILIENLLYNCNKTEIDYIINDYLNKLDINIIITYINKNCNDSILKINFIKKNIEKYFENNNIELLNLLKILLNIKLLNKLDLNNSFKLIKNDNINNIINFFN